MMKTLRLIAYALLLVLSTFRSASTQNCVNDTIFSDVLFVIDNSQSISTAEYALFEQTIVATIASIQDNCPMARVAVMHYGGSFGQEVSVEFDFAVGQQINNVQRQFCVTQPCPSGGDDLNAAIDSARVFIDDGRLDHIQDNELEIVIFSDAFTGLECEGPGAFVNCSQIDPFTAIDALKGQPYNANVTVVGATVQAEARRLALYASPGGDFDNVTLDPVCSATFDGCTLPRQYIPIEFNSPALSTATEIASLVSCGIQIIPMVGINLIADMTIVCSNLGQTADLTASAVGGTAPFTFEFDNNLGIGAEKTVAPTEITTFTATVTDANGCQASASITIDVDPACCPETLNLTVTGDDTFCQNVPDSATIVADMTFGTAPISYTWDNGLPDGPVQNVSPDIETTYTVTAVDAVGCTLIETFTVTPIFCPECDIESGYPVEPQKICAVNGQYEIFTEPNTMVNTQGTFDIIYLLTNEDLVVIDLSIGPRTFFVTEPGVYRVHTLVAEVTDPTSPDFLDLDIIELGSSNLFIVGNCITNHDICADIDLPGRATKALPDDDFSCQQFENSINLCTDGLDNDDDGLVDCADEDCQLLEICNERSFVACNDLFDNDGDGLIDCNDPDCFVFNICFEQDEICNDGIDNDRDGLIDCMDDSCAGASSCMENNVFTCLDGIDNDGDGLIDCQEEVCQRFIICAEATAEACADGLDNDFDGLVDCADSQCHQALSSMCAASEASATFCSDGIDNDGDGLVDCSDPDCGFILLESLESTASQFVVVNETTCPENRGSIRITGELDSDQFQYSINMGPAQFNPSFGGLEPGEYTLSITSSGVCSITVDFEIAEGGCVEICSDGLDNDGDGLVDCMDEDCGVLGFEGRVVINDPTCPTRTNGSIIINGALEGLSYQYSIDGGQTFQSDSRFNNVSPGAYPILVRTLDGCIFEDFALVNSVGGCAEFCSNGIDDDGDGLTDCEDPDCGLSGFAGAITVNSVTCDSLNSGSIIIGGQAPNISYTYSADGGFTFQNNPIITGLPAGQYSVIVRSDMGCEFDEVIVVDSICDPSEICDNGLDDDGDGLTDCDDPDCGVTDFVVTVEEITCNGPMTGSITIDGQLSGVEYTYSIDAGVSFQASPIFNNVVAGSYLIIVNTEVGCQFSQAVVLESPNCGGGMSGEICDNGIDDDGDGLTDCDDPDCGVIELSVVVDEITCIGDMTGSITVSGQVVGITYVYSLDGGQSQSSPLFSGLLAGSYLVSASTGSGSSPICAFSQAVVLDSPNCDGGTASSEIFGNGIDDDGDGLIDCDDPDGGTTALTITTQDVTCDGPMTGSIAIGGQLAGVVYTYSIDNGQTFQPSSLITGLVAGSYDIVVRTADGCEYTSVATLSIPNCDGGTASSEIFGNGIDDDGDGLIDCDDPDGGTTALTITTQDITCDGPMTGSIVIGGQLAGVIYTYSIDNGQTFQASSTFTGLVAGSYDIVVSTADGCEFTSFASLSTPTCDGGPTVEICDNGIDDDGDGLTDCDDPDCGIADLTISVGQVTCDGPMTGSISITGQQDGIAYNYSIDNGATFQTSAIFSNLISGDYSVLVETGGGCQFAQQITLEDPVCNQGPEICDNGIDDDGDGLTDCDDPDCGVSVADFVVNTTDATCDMDDGSILVSSTSTEEFVYSIDGGVTTQEGLTALFEGLAPTTGSGTSAFSLVVTNAFGCSITTEVDINQEMCNNNDICDMFMAEAPTVVPSSCPDNNNGAIIFDAPSVGFSFSIDGINFFPFGLFNNLDSGQYTLFVQNADGCIDEVPVTVPGMECQMASETFSSGIFDLRVILEGPYDVDDDLMNTTLNDLGYLPGQRPTTFFGEPFPSGQPYNQSPWFYDGEEGVGVSERDLYDDSVVDWVLVSLRANELRPSTFWRGAGLLHEDGTIEMIQEPDLTEVEDREFFVVIEHRNHLPVMSPTMLTVRGGQVTYDFSEEDSFREIIGDGQKELSNGVYVMAAGNGDVDTEVSSIIDINVRDLNLWIDANGLNSSYFFEDYDLNGDINIRDRELWQENNGIFSTIPYRE